MQAGRRAIPNQSSRFATASKPNAGSSPSRGPVVYDHPLNLQVVPPDSDWLIELIASSLALFTPTHNNEAYVLDIKYNYPLVHTNDSDLCIFHTVGTNLLARVVTVWRGGRDKVNPLLGDSLPETRTTHEPTLPLPYEIAEMIIAHLIHDLNALEACSLTCRSWYIIAVPHIHHTLILGRGATPGGLKPLSEPHRQGLIHLVQEIRVEQWPGVATWFMPRAFNRHTIRYFPAFSNVRALRLQRLEITRFIPHIERYFGQFSPTLRSLMLSELHCTPLQLPYFLSSFPNLDDIGIRGNRTWHPTIRDNNPNSFSAQSLRGRLILRGFPWAQTRTHLASCGGLRSRHVDLRTSVGCVPDLLGGMYRDPGDATIQRDGSLT